MFDKMQMKWCAGFPKSMMFNVEMQISAPFDSAFSFRAVRMGSRLLNVRWKKPPEEILTMFSRETSMSIPNVLDASTTSKPSLVTSVTLHDFCSSAAKASGR